MNGRRSITRIVVGLLTLAIVLTAAPLAGMPAQAAPPNQATTLLINEVDSDTPSYDKLEFIELYDGGAGNTALDGLVVVLYNGSDNASYAAFDLDGFSTDADGYFVIGTVAEADLYVNPGSSGWLQNGADAVALHIGDAADFPNDTPVTTNNLIDALVYDTSDSDDPELLVLLNAVQPQVNEGGGGDKDNHSNQRCPNGEGGARNTGTYTQFTPTPGATNCELPPPPVYTIMEIQGAGDQSPHEGETITTSGIVTLFTTDGRSFWLQDPEGDGDPATSDGIFVFRGADLSPSLAVGDLASVTAVVQEYRSYYRPTDLTLTELSSVSDVAILSSGNPLPTPIELSDLPDESISDAITLWESLEGMLVSVDNAPVVGATSDYGEFAVLAKNDAKPGSGFYPETQQILLRDLGGGNVDYNPERILVDDSTLDDAIIVVPGDRVRSLVGAVDYTYGNYKLQPASYDVKTHNLPNLPASTRSGPKGDVVITTFNVENLFDLEDNPDKDDEGSTPTPEELEIQLTKLATAIQVELELPDILVVQEVENTAILQELGNRVNAAAGTDYMAASFETSDVRGIEVGLLWDANRVTYVDAFQLTDDIVPGVSAAFGPTSPSAGREPLVGVFEIKGRTITIVGNHFKSKGGDDPLFGVNDPPVRITEAQRKAQAQVVRDFVDFILDPDLNALVMVTGDLNDFQFAEPGEGADHPIAILEGIGGGIELINLVNLEKDDERFTYVYDGNTEVLDHTLVSPALYNLFVAVDMLHFNAGFPDGLGADATTTLRSSDHDAIESRFSF